MEGSSSTGWGDFDTLRHSIKSYTVDKLKNIINGINEECGSTLPKTGKKQDLIDRISAQLESFRPNHPDKWSRARAVLYQVRQSGTYTPSNPSFASTSFSAVSRYTSSTPMKTSTPNGHRLNNSSLMTPNIYAPPRLPTQSSSSSSQAATSASLKFKTSPFFRIDEPVSEVLTCPESTGQTDRRACNLKFTLTQSQINKLQQSGPKFQLRLFCTSSAFYTPGTFRTSGPCLIEFPATCEVRVNNAPLAANLKGVKKRPGTAPPADLTSLVRKAPGVVNALEIIYINSQPNTPPKKFYLAVNLVETTSVDQLVERLQTGKRKSYAEVKEQMAKTAKEDDDIVAGKQSMSLKCPLSFTRIKTPTRSEKCVHPQCFDATSWYTVMEQTTTWLCPICERVLEPGELFVDGYFEQILSSTHEDVDEVEVEPDGEWHTSDNKYASLGWLSFIRLKAGSAVDIKPLPIAKPLTDANKSPISSSANQGAASGDGEIYVLDSDSDREAEGQVRREISPGHRRTSNGFVRNGAAFASARAAVPPRPQSSTVIDLTLDSDPEDIPLRTQYQATKRKADDALADYGVEVTKRAREGPSIGPIARRDSGSRYSAAPPTSIGSANSSSSSHASPFNNSRTLPPPIPTRHSSSGSLPGSFNRSLSIGSSSPRYTNGGDSSPLNGYNQSQRSVHAGPFASVSGDSRRLPPPNPSPNGFGYNHEGYAARLNGGGNSNNSSVSSSGNWPR